MFPKAAGIAVLLAFLPVCVTFECMSQTGDPVDWYIIYKLPIMTEVSNRLVRDGVGYYYMDSVHTEWTLSNVGINELQGNAVYHTLQQIYGAKDLSNMTYAMYNDETPVGTVSITHGHSKGAFAFEMSGGFWLITSTPKFPNIRTGGYVFPKNAMVFGQTMMCVSLTFSDLEEIAELMTYTYPKFYDKYIPDSFAGGNPTLAALLAYRQKHVTVAPFKLESTIHSKGGEIFHNFAKATGFGADLYDAWLSERINHNLYVETWQNGPHDNVIRSNCTEVYKVYNIQELIFPIGSFDEEKDHSKWAISRTGKWLCIGDINRQYTQFKRGGSTMCLVDNKAWEAFYYRIRDYETCGPM